MKENKVRDKIIEIEKYLEELESVLPLSLEEYKNNFKLRLMGERSFEKIVEAVVDLSFLIVDKEDLKNLEEEEKVFDILKNKGIISEVLFKKLKRAKGMRNFIAHRYGMIDDELVFHSLTEELILDVHEFIKLIKNLNFV